MEQTCSRAETEISKISLQQREMVITVDQGIKLLPCGFPMYTVKVNRFHLSLDFPFPPFFYSSLIVCLPVSSSPRNSIQEETKSSDSHTSSSIPLHRLFSAFILSVLSFSSFEICFFLSFQRQNPPNSCSVPVSLLLLLTCAFLSCLCD